MNSTRVVNGKSEVISESLNSVDFMNPQNSLVFRTTKSEKHRLVFQLGTASPERALKVLKLIEKDVTALDINMGCPKHFSISGGMGAALLSDKEKAYEILETLVRNSTIPITCKIRLLPGDISRTVDFIEHLLPSGVVAITVHGRTKCQRSSEPCNIEGLRHICEVFKHRVPIIVNGESLNIQTKRDIDLFKELCGATSVMIGRAAIWNPAIFSNEVVPFQTVIDEIIRLFMRWDLDFRGLKYILIRMKCGSIPGGEKISSADSYESIWSADV
ncbi:tRNA-dihydrouridine(20) synthase [NAD(P)+]-like protein [Thelohanellus kitauei]|uniref:tRNA-dihydrouridine(20) synthase [NAD(P)+]-like protein n=1 Tax=Thelohanellus kitauei TaxID=669202 RepID=A0A0C2I552_THEKT|nr:tRNA-dihydrouridine(20) synthase [NAD(P)+]-like protein [Thelohanellus kitauei]